MIIERSGAPLLQLESLSLRAGMRVALTGPSDSGQAQLLALLAGEAVPAAGRVMRPAGTRVVQAGLAAPRAGATVREVAEQGLAHLRALEAEMRRMELSLDSAEQLDHYGELSDAFARAGGHAAETELERTLHSFGFATRRMAERFCTLSSGEKQRVLLAGALASAADVLLLHEPDAGLDRAGLEWLARRLRRWPGAVMFSSHNRAFMSETASHVASIRSGKVTLVRGRWPAPRFRLGTGKAGGQARKLFSWPELTVRADGRPLFTAPGLAVHSGERIVLAGHNGAGKSTLLGLLSADAYHGTGATGIVWEDRVSVVAPQTGIPGEPGVPLLSRLRQLMSDARARQLLGLLNVPRSDWFLAAEDLSEEVLARVSVITSLASEADVLLLDEPTVRLDLPSIELLEEALLTRGGATILVTHDEALAMSLATRVWEIRDGELLDHRGGVDGWRAGRLRIEPGPKTAPEPGGIPASVPAEDRVEQAEAELASIEAELDDPVGVPETRLARLRVRRSNLIDRLSELIDERLSPPLPRFRVRESGVVIEADVSPAGLELTLPDGVEASVRVSGAVAHLSARGASGTVLLPSARRDLVNALTRLSFYALGIRVVQYWDANPPDGLLLRPAGNDWHALALEQFERLEGWTSSPASSRRGRRP